MVMAVMTTQITALQGPGHGVRCNKYWIPLIYIDALTLTTNFMAVTMTKLMWLSGWEQWRCWRLPWLWQGWSFYFADDDM